MFILMFLWNQECRDSCEEWNGTEEERVALSARKDVEREKWERKGVGKMCRGMLLSIFTTFQKVVVWIEKVEVRILTIGP